MAMTNAVPNTRELTNAVLEHLTSALGALESPVLVGDALAPPEGGWSGHQPGSGQFTPYTVFKPGNGAPGRTPDSLGLDYATWNLAFAMNHTGGARDQAQWVADQVHTLLTDWRPLLSLADISWRVQKVVFTQIGGVTPDQQSSPNYWTAADVGYLMVSR